MPTLTPPVFSLEHGKKYIRIVRTDQNKNYTTGKIEDGQRSAWGFIEMGTGHILMTAGWKAPAKHPRGNIFNKDPWQGMTNYGPARWKTPSDHSTQRIMGRKSKF